MGVPQFPLLDQPLKQNWDLINGSLLKNILEAHAKRKTRVVSRKSIQNSNKKSVIRRVRMKRQAHWGLKRKLANGVIERRVRTLKRLIPHRESIGLVGLFRETADYILALQMRVRVMQNMVKVLTDSVHEE